MASSPIISWQIDEETMEIVTDYIFLEESNDQPRQHIKKQRRYFTNKGPSSQSYIFSSSHVWMWELDCKESWVLKNWCFWTVVLEKTLENPLDCKEIQPVHPKGDQSWVFIGRTDAEAETPILWLLHAKSWLSGKDPDDGKDWGQEKKDFRSPFSSILKVLSVQSVSSVAHSHPTLCDPMDCSMSGFPGLHYLQEFAQTHVHWFSDAIQPSHPLSPSSSCPQSFPASGSFLMSQLFTSGGKSIEVSASALVLQMIIQGWFPLRLTGLISLLSKGLSRVFSSTTVRKQQFFGTQPSLWSNSHMCM